MALRAFAQLLPPCKVWRGTVHTEQIQKVEFNGIPYGEIVRWMTMICEGHRVSSFKSCDVLQMMTSIAYRKYLSYYLSKYLQCSFKQQIWKYFSMEISNEKCSAADGFNKWRRRSAEIRERRGLWNSIDLRALPGLCHPCRRRCTQSQDQGFGIWDFLIHIKSCCQEKNTSNPKKNPTPVLWHRRHCCCAEPEYQLHTWLISSCQWLLHPEIWNCSHFVTIFLYD